MHRQSNMQLESKGGRRRESSAVKRQFRSQLTGLVDGTLILAEVLAKHVYWGLPFVRRHIKSLRSKAKSRPQILFRRELKDYLRQIGVSEGALVMAHTAVTNLQLRDDASSGADGGFLQTADNLVNDLLELVGPGGTLAMPTHAIYQNEEAFFEARRSGNPIRYDPQQTPCMVGLANELFWRRKGVLRSLHPYNTLAACGPLAAELLENNLNDNKPLAHGVYSGYYRVCRLNGLVISVGIPLRHCMTLLHVGEDVRDEQWPIEDFFEERPYLIRIDGKDELHIVRQCREKYAKYAMCRRMPFNELIREGVIHEDKLGEVPVGWARAAEVFDYLMRRNEHSTYPYYGIRLAGMRK
jgi:aminoglycoside 3-N-acetyltransferase